MFIKTTGRNWMKRLRQGRGRSLLRKRIWLITRIHGVSRIQGTRVNLLTTSHSDRGQRNKEAWWKIFNSYMGRFMRKRPILLTTKDYKKKTHLQY